MTDQRKRSRADRLAALEAHVAAIDAKVRRAQWLAIAIGVVLVIGRLCRWW